MLKKQSQSINYILILFIIYLASAMIVSPTKAMSAAENALNLCARTVMPSLFPFIFCGNMFIALGAARIMGRYLSRIMHPLFGISGAGALALVLGIVSGYPVGASCAASLYRSGECTKTEAERLLAFCNNSGPMFIIGAVGIGMLGSQKLGIFLYIVHIFSSLICGMLFRLWGRDKSTNHLPPSRPETEIKNAAPDIGAAIAKSVDTILTICGFIVIFAVFTAVIPDSPIKKYIYCLFEITGGVKELLKDSSFITLPLTSFFIALSGISVFCQVTAIITPQGISPVPYILGKLAQGFIAFGLTFAAMKISPQAVPVFYYTNTPITPTPSQLTATALLSLTAAVITVVILLIIAKILEYYNK